VRVLLADGELLALERLAHLLRGLPHIQVAGTATSGEIAASLIVALKPDLTILDTQIPRQSDTALADTLNEADGLQVIVISAFTLDSAQALEVDATDYLLKPVTQDRLVQALERARRRRCAGTRRPRRFETGLASDTRWLWAPTRHGPVRVPIADVILAEAAGDHVLLHTTDRTHMLRTTIADMTERLSRFGMIRAHRSALVRPSAVTNITSGEDGGALLKLIDGSAVNVGPLYRNSIFSELGIRSETSFPTVGLSASPTR
jgi:two-component system, LytTR family, response regulator